MRVKILSKNIVQFLEFGKGKNFLSEGLEDKRRTFTSVCDDCFVICEIWFDKFGEVIGTVGKKKGDFSQGFCLGIFETVVDEELPDGLIEREMGGAWFFGEGGEIPVGFFEVIKKELELG